jgi:hypothetical protein
MNNRRFSLREEPVLRGHSYAETATQLDARRSLRSL